MARLAVLVSLLLPLSSFAAKPIDRGCFLPPDQGHGSLFGTWEQLPIHLVFDSEFYEQNNGMEAQALERAAGTWNEWARSKGKVAFVITKKGEGAAIPELTDCAHSSYTEAMPNVVGVWKIDGVGFRANHRPSCGENANGTPGKLMPFGVQGQTDWIVESGKIRASSVLLNFEDYNGPGKMRIDTESNFLHQLGHVLGLLHSCNGSGPNAADSTTAPACFKDGQVSAPKEYIDATMFPFLETLQLRRTLQQNDIDRASCLY